MVAAFLVAFVRDSILFLTVKKQGRKLLDKKPKLQEKLDRASSKFNDNPRFFMTFHKLMYGFSTVVVMLSGLKENINYSKFAFHSFIGSAVWVLVYGGFGYFCANMMIENLNFINEHKLEVISILSMIGLTYWFFVKRPKDKHLSLIHI